MSKLDWSGLVKTGVWRFMSMTMTAMVLLMLRGGEPLSEAITVTSWVPELPRKDCWIRSSARSDTLWIEKKLDPLVLGDIV